MLYTEEEKKFIEYWEKNRGYQASLKYQLIFGIPYGLLFSFPIFLNFLLSRFWYKRADAVAVSQFNPIVLGMAILLLSVFIAIINRKFRWERLENQYLELMARKH